MLGYEPLLPIFNASHPCTWWEYHRCYLLKNTYRAHFYLDCKPLQMEGINWLENIFLNYNLFDISLASIQTYDSKQFLREVHSFEPPLSMVRVYFLFFS